MLGDYFYHSTIKKAVAVFGTLFNNITVKRIGDSQQLSQYTKVPFSYGPRQKFLERIRAQRNLKPEEPELALKLPRMSFEMSSITIDTGSKLNPLNKLSLRNDVTQYDVFRQAVPYVIGFQLFVYGKNQDDVLQIVEQILPNFAPEYTVTVKDMEHPGSRTDVPVVLNGISPSDDYEGSLDSNRVIIYTLDFSMKVKFGGQVQKQRIIKEVDVDYFDKILADDLEPIRQETHTQTTPTGPIISIILE